MRFLQFNDVYVRYDLIGMVSMEARSFNGLNECTQWAIVIGIITPYAREAMKTMTELYTDKEAAVVRLDDILERLFNQ